MSKGSSLLTAEQGMFSQSLGATCFWERHGNTHSITRSSGPDREFSAVSSCLFWSSTEEIPVPSIAHYAPCSGCWPCWRKKGLLQNHLWACAFEWRWLRFPLKLYVKLWTDGFSTESFVTSSWSSKYPVAETCLRISPPETNMTLLLCDS